MAMANAKARCVTCGKERATAKCGGCSQDFCYKHLGDHRQELGKQLDEVEVMRDLFRQAVDEQKTDPEKHLLLQQIDEWERDSIKKIHQTGEEARQVVRNHLTVQFTEIERKLNELTEQLRQSREEEDFFESDLHQWTKELNQLKEQLANPSGITIHQHQTPLITKISANTLSNQTRLCPVNIEVSARWEQNGIIVAGGNGRGTGLNQLNNSYGVFVDDDQTIYAVDTCNHRIMEWKSGATKGQIVAGGNGEGSRNDQLNRPYDVIVDKASGCLIISDVKNRRVVRWPRQGSASGQTIISSVDCTGLAMDDRGYLYVADSQRNEIRRWRTGDTVRTLVAGGNGPGNRLNQLHYPYNIVVDSDHSVYVSDLGNHRVMKWTEGAKEGVIVAGRQGQGNSLAQLNCPRGIVVDQSGTVYVVDDYNHRVMRWLKGSIQGSIVVGGYGTGKKANQISGPTGLSMDRHGNLYVVDFGNDRVEKFNIRQNLSSS